MAKEMSSSLLRAVAAAGTVAAVKEIKQLLKSSAVNVNGRDVVSVFF